MRREGKRAGKRAGLNLRCGVALVVLALFVPLGVPAGEIYRWTDSAGRIHFTQDLAQVPPAKRRAAEAAAQEKPGLSPVQTYKPPASRSRDAITRPMSAGGADPDAGRVYKIRVQQAGNAMIVLVRINDQLNVPFHIDTGASDVVLPRWAAEKLDLDLENARTGIYGTANGVVSQRLVRLRSVSLGGARVENVPAAVSPTMSKGLLGLSYFNHFKYDVDPVNGLVTLRRNDLAKKGILRGGRSRSQWAQQFAFMQTRIRTAEQARDDVPFGRTRKRQAFDEEVTRLEGELETLGREADEARVPFAWRN
jgi:clan AA aspartic protease (TIGR02281 family)